MNFQTQSDLHNGIESLRVTPATARMERRRRDTPSCPERIDPSVFKRARNELQIILDAAQARMRPGEEAGSATHTLVVQMWGLREACGPMIWSELIPLAKAHPILDLLLQDPFTRRSFQKPRGYSGDGELLDLLYRHKSVRNQVHDATRLGQDIYEYTSVSACSTAVQERRAILAEIVDAIGATRPNAEILSVACGHLREAELSKALQTGRLQRWVAMDQDKANLDVVSQVHVDDAVWPLLGSVKGILSRSYDLGAFDLVYSAGVYDYLPFPIAVALTRRLFEQVKPGGACLFANFSTEVVPAAYMETFMNWPVIQRTKEDMSQIVNCALRGQNTRTEIYFGENRHIIYANVTKLADKAD